MFGIYEINNNRLADLEDVVENLCGSETVSGVADEVWAIARGHEKIPPIDNIHYSVLYSHIAYALMEDYSINEDNIEYYVNCYCSSFSVNVDGDWYEIADTCSLNTFLEVLEAQQAA